MPRSRLMLIAVMASAMSCPFSATAQSPANPEPENVTAQAQAVSQGDAEGDMLAGAQQAQPQSLFDALRWAYENNPTIRSNRAGLLASQELLPQAQSGYKPSASVTAGLNKTWVNSSPSGVGDGSFGKDIGLNLDQPLYRGGRTFSSIESAKNAIMAQRAFLNQTEENILFQVATAYMNVLRDQSLLNLAENNRDVISKQLDASKARFEVGDITRTDVSQSQARLADSESGRIAALGNLRSSLAVYAQLVGMPLGRLSFPKMNLRLPATLDESVTMAETYNPTVLAAQFLHNSAEKDIETIFGELLPSVDLGGSVGYSADPSPGIINNETSSVFGVTATIPLYDAGLSRSRVRQAKSTAKQRLIAVEDAQRQAREQAVSAWEALTAARAEIESRKAQVEANIIASDGVHKEAELGTRTILDALNADQELLNARSALVTARRNEVVARFALATALGILTPDMLGFPELDRDYNQHITEITDKVFSTDTQYDPDTAIAAKAPINH